MAETIGVIISSLTVIGIVALLAFGRHCDTSGAHAQDYQQHHGRTECAAHLCARLACGLESGGDAVKGAT